MKNILKLNFCVLNSFESFQCKLILLTGVLNKTSLVTYNHGEVIAVRQLSISHSLQIDSLDNKCECHRNKPGRENREVNSKNTYIYIYILQLLKTVKFSDQPFKMQLKALKHVT